MARYLPNGQIEFLGRIDYQVKIRGYRIELGEIDYVLGQHPAVRACVVLAREEAIEEHDEPEHLKSKTRTELSRRIGNLKSDKHLVAYIVANPGATLEVRGLVSFLKQELPDYMVPSAFVFLDVLPLTPNGKVDRRALPEPNPARPNLGDGYVAPRNAVEEVLAGIWVEALKLERVGIHDNFFDLGGHSLLATRLVSRVREVLQVDLALRTLFEKPTVAELTATILQEMLDRDKIERTAQLFIKLSRISSDEVETLLSEKRLLQRDKIH